MWVREMTGGEEIFKGGKGLRKMFRVVERLIGKGKENFKGGKRSDRQWKVNLGKEGDKGERKMFRRGDRLTGKENEGKMIRENDKTRDV